VTGVPGLSSRRPENVLLLLAHHDDEYFVTARLLREVAAGNSVHVVFATHGSVRGTAASVREHESAQLFARIGIPQSRVNELGRELQILDGQAVDNLSRIRDGCLRAYQETTFSRLITLAWEGGHPDHDATHLVAQNLATRWAIPQLFEFPVYTQAGAPSFLFRVNRFSGKQTAPLAERVGFAERLRLFLWFRLYPSQWRSFLGLLPEAAFRMLVQGRQQLRQVASTDYLRPPHEGRLFYEKRFSTTFDSFLTRARPFIEGEPGSDEASA
jgi:LmbE family N-acetylglucosaminyl deacetylase